MITPIEIQKTEFKMSAHGYSKQQVDEFKEIILKDYETLYRQSLEYGEQIEQLNEKVNYYSNMEKSLHKALVLAEKSAEETKRTAGINAEAIEKEARAEADKIILEAKKQLADIQSATLDLCRQYETYRAQFIASANSQIQLLNSDSFKFDITKLDAYKLDAESSEEKES